MTLWHPRAERVHGNDGGTLLGGPPRATWHTTEGSSIEGAVAAYRSADSWPTLTWDPDSGRIVQHLPADVAARSLRNPSGGVETNRMGRVHVQIEVVARAVHPFTQASRMEGFPGLLRWLDRLGVPRRWPAGRPLAYPDSYGSDNPQRRPQLWTSKGGHYGHSQVPENDHGDPGHITLAAWSTDRVHPAEHDPADYPPFPGPLHRGDKGPDVTQLQRQLRHRGWTLKADGHYGPRTEDVVRAFQRDKGLDVTGWVDKRTWRLIWTAKVTA